MKERRSGEGAGRALAAMACGGAFALLAQAVLWREFLVAYGGSELTLGAALGLWLALVGAGAWLARQAPAGWAPGRVAGAAACLLALAAVLLPAQWAAMRVARTWIGVLPGEAVPWGALLASLGVILADLCLSLGALFPLLCRLAGHSRPGAAAAVYALEALGSLAAGLLFTFWLVRAMTPLAVVALAGALALLAASGLAPRALPRVALGLLAFAWTAAAACPAARAPLERAALEARWRSLGALAPGGGRLLASADSPYQNLALIETEGQYALYADGRILGVFPDPVEAEHRIHFIMAQNPGAQRVLLLGGNPVNDLPELLRYPLRELVYVEADEAVGRLLAAAAPEAYRRALTDPRLTRVHTDGPRYVKRAAGGFDAILIEAPEPATIGLNRFYTREFYRDVRALLAPSGFVCTAVAASEHLQAESAVLSASVRTVLGAEFDRVWVTAGPVNRFFAGAAESAVTLDPETLRRRSEGAGLETRYFRPEYMLGAEALDPVKCRETARRLAAIPVEINTVTKPVSTLYQAAVWSRLSGSGLEPVLKRLARLPAGWVAAALLAAGAAGLGAGVRARVSRRGRDAASPAAGRRALLRLLAATGCCGMALEVALIVVYQSLLGYLYSRIGLITALFMLGLAAGAWGARRRMPAGRIPWRTLAVTELLWIVAAAALPLGPRLGLLGGAAWGWIEVLLGAWIGGIGYLVGAQFALVNQALCALPGADPGKAASLAYASDVIGASAGSLLAGALLLPVFGLASAAGLLAALKMATLLGLLGACARCAGGGWKA